MCQRRTIWLALLLSAAILGCNSNRSQPSTGPQTKPFKVAFNTWVGYSPLVIAKERGYLEEVGLDVDISFLEGIGEKNSALLRGEIDAVGHTADSAVTSAASGVDGQIVFVFDRSLGADAILAKTSIKSIADLKGKKVALEPGFTGHFFFLALLTEAGLTPSDVEIIPMDTGTAGSAFLSGQVDVAVTWEPWIGKSKDVPDVHILVSSKDRPGLIIDVLYMTNKTIRERPEDVEKLIAAMGRATDWYLQNKLEGDKIIAKFWKLSLEEEQETVAGMEFMTLDENTRFFGTADSPGPLLNTVSQANQLWFETGVIKKTIKPERLIYFQGVNAAARSNSR